MTMNERAAALTCKHRGAISKDHGREDVPTGALPGLAVSGGTVEVSRRSSARVAEGEGLGYSGERIWNGS